MSTACKLVDYHSSRQPRTRFVRFSHKFLPRLRFKDPGHTEQILAHLSRDEGYSKAALALHGMPSDLSGREIDGRHPYQRWVCLLSADRHFQVKHLRDNEVHDR